MSIKFHKDTPMALVNDMAMQHGMEIVDLGGGNHEMRLIEDDGVPLDEEDKLNCLRRQAD